MIDRPAARIRRSSDAVCRDLCWFEREKGERGDEVRRLTWCELDAREEDGRSGEP